jgi:type IV pilus assembly protein PilW
MRTLAQHGSGSGFACGLSLVELMVSMLLGVLLGAGVISAYIGAKRNYFYEEQMARMQENGRYAMRLLSRELDMAGFFGGFTTMAEVAAATVGSDCSDNDWILDTRNPLELVNDYSGRAPLVSLHDTTLTCLDAAAVMPNSDLVAIKRTAAEASVRWGVPAADLTASSTASWYLRVASTGGAQWEQLRPIDLQRPEVAVAGRSYWEAVARIFYIRSRAGSAEDGENIPGLCMETLAGNGMTSRCLVEGVENMQLELGIDTDADAAPNFYVAAPAPADMQRAVAIKIHLLLRSIDQLAGHQDDGTYRLGQTTIAATHDAYLRRVFSATVFLRNRVDPIG